jgi:hypothetical protein
MKTTPNTPAIKPIVISADLKEALFESFRAANLKHLEEGGCIEHQFEGIGEDTPEGETIQVFTKNCILGNWRLAEILRAHGVDVDHNQLFESDDSHQIVYDDPDHYDRVIIYNPRRFHFLLTK